jgi:hypothetical protein
MKSETKALLIGIPIGQAIWVLAYLGAIAHLGAAFEQLALPAMFHADHPNWAETPPSHIAFGLFLYGVLGGIVGALVHQWRSTGYTAVMRPLWLVFATFFLFMALSTVWDGNHNAELLAYVSMAVLCLPGKLRRLVVR